RRIGQELHDSLGQSLNVLKLKLEGLTAALPDESPRKALSESVSLLSSVIGQARTLMFELYPAILDQLRLTSTLRHYCAQLTSQINGVCEGGGTGPVAPIPPAAAGFLLRAVKGRINNALNGGKARRIIIQIRRSKSAFRVVGCDPGGGLLPEPSVGHGM